VPHTGLRDLVIEVAAQEGVPIQFDRVAGGGTDAGKIQLYGAGVPSLVVGVAVRYIHTHAAILHRDDFDQAARLMTAVAKRLDTATVTQLRA
jgi:endoglucanase